MKAITLLICLLSNYAIAQGVSISGSERLSIGAELASASYVATTNVGQSEGIGVLGSYKLDPHWSIQGDMFFSTHVTTYQIWTWYGPYNQLVNSNSVALTVGPVYRASRKALSPVIGAMLSYQHDYNNIPNPYSYGAQPSYGVDSLYAGPMAGLEYRITNDITVGIDFRYMMNLGSQGNMPAPYNVNTNQNYYMAGINLKFSF